MSRNFTMIALMALVGSAAQAQEFGKFPGPVQAEWVLPDGRRMRLLSNFLYYDPKGMEWLAPTGSIVDGASIPRFAWSIIGGPFEGRYREASVVHDVACEQKARPWEDVHEMFYWGMRANGVDSWLAKVMYAAVYYFGPRWPRRVLTGPLRADLIEAARRGLAEGAAPGSQAEIQAAIPEARLPGGAQSNVQQWFFQSKPDADYLSRPGADLFHLEIVVKPPQNTLTEADFAELRKRIETQEAAASGGLSLEAIRNYRPAK